MFFLTLFFPFFLLIRDGSLFICFLPLKAEFLLKAWVSLLDMARRSVVGDFGLRFAFAALFTRFHLSVFFFFGSWGMFWDTFMDMDMDMDMCFVGGSFVGTTVHISW